MTSGAPLPTFSTTIAAVSAEEYATYKTFVHYVNPKCDETKALHINKSRRKRMGTKRIRQNVGDASRGPEAASADEKTDTSLADLDPWSALNAAVPWWQPPVAWCRLQRTDE